MRQSKITVVVLLFMYLSYSLSCISFFYILGLLLYQVAQHIPTCHSSDFPHIGTLLQHQSLPLVHLTPILTLTWTTSDHCIAALLCLWSQQPVDSALQMVSFRLASCLLSFWQQLTLILSEYLFNSFQSAAMNLPHIFYVINVSILHQPIARHLYISLKHQPKTILFKIKKLKDIYYF